MSLVTINDYYLRDIANAIRSKLDVEDTYKPRQMGPAIRSITTFSTGLDAGVKEFVERTLEGEVVVDCDYFGIYSFAEMNDMTAITAPNATSVKEYAFYSCNGLCSVNMPNVTLVDSNAFLKCWSLYSVNMPSLTEIRGNGFSEINAEVLTFPAIKTLRSYAISDNSNLAKIDLGSNLTNLESECIENCPNLTAIIIRNPVVLPKVIEQGYPPFNLDQFFKGYEGEKPGYIYVPAAMIEKYESFEYTYDSYGYDYWDYYTFRAIEDYPEICG